MDGFAFKYGFLLGCSLDRGGDLEQPRRGVQVEGVSVGEEYMDWL